MIQLKLPTRIYVSTQSHQQYRIHFIPINIIDLFIAFSVVRYKSISLRASFFFLKNPHPNVLMQKRINVPQF